MFCENSDMNFNLDTKFLTVLIDAIEDIATVKVQSDKYDYKELLSEFYLINQYRYYLIMTGEELSPTEFMEAYINSKSALYKQMELLKSCYDYANRTSDKYGILPSSDFLKINKALTTQSIDSLTKPLDAELEEKINVLWDILKDLYDSKNDTPKIIKLSIFLYNLENFEIPVNAHLKDMVLNFILNDTFEINHKSFFSSYQLIIEPLSKETSEIYIYQFFKNISGISKRKSQLIVQIENANDKLGKTISEHLPKLYNEKMMYLLNNNMFLTNDKAKESLNVSTKTAISYLKQLEDKGILTHLITGKEIYYVRNDILRIFEEF